MIYGYARVSTKGQVKYGESLEEQGLRLSEAGAKEIFADAFTGTKLERPAFSKLLNIVQSGDTIIVTKLDRISRSASQGINLAEELLSRGIKLHILNMGVLDDTPTGKLIRNIMFSFAEFERDMIVQRTMEGKQIARQKEGYREGRPPLEVDEAAFADCRRRVSEGTATVTECCKELGICRSSWYNLIKKTA